MAKTTASEQQGRGQEIPVLTSDERLDADALELHRALADLIRVYQFRDRDRICCYDVSVTQCYALEAIIRHGPLSLNELAAHLYLDKSTTSRIVDALQKKGYVHRREDPEDRRALHLVATPEGKELHTRIERDMLAQEKRLIEGFAPEVRQSMARLIHDLAMAAARSMDPSQGACCAAR